MGESVFIISLILFNIIFVVFLVAILVFIKSYRTKKKAHDKELLHKELKHREELLITKLEIQTQTMEYIGREIHDNVGQKLTLSCLYLQQIMQKGIPHQNNSQIKQVNTIINESLGDLRLLSKDLTNDQITFQSFNDLIALECRKLEELKLYRVAYNNDTEIVINTYNEKSILLRITQEFIQNSIKHAKCTEISITLRDDDKGNFVLVLKDNGVGFNTKSLDNKGIGLDNIKKRIKMLDGHLTMYSNENEGVCLTITLNRP